MYILEDWRNANHCKLSHFADLNTAEEHAVQLMNKIKDQLPSKAWGRGEWSMNNDYQEYTERKAKGWARVYVRIHLSDTPYKCQTCGDQASHLIRAGNFCDTCFAMFLDKGSK